MIRTGGLPTSFSAGPTTETVALARQSTGEALLEIRLLSGLTWELLGELFKVSRRTIHYWANGRAPSAQHEYDIRRTLDVIRHLDEGSQRATRDRLRAIENGASIFELLAESRYDDVMRQAVGSDSVATLGRPIDISEKEWDRRRPATPDFLLGAIQDRPSIRVMSARVVRPARRNQDPIPL